jgi:hypothetical protein
LFDFEITIVAGAIFSVIAKGAGAIISASAVARRLTRTIHARARFGIVAHVVAESVGLIAITNRRLICSPAKPARDRDRRIAGRSAVVAADEAEANE